MARTFLYTEMQSHVPFDEFDWQTVNFRPQVSAGSDPEDLALWHRNEHPRRVL